MAVFEIVTVLLWLRLSFADSKKWRIEKDTDTQSLCICSKADYCRLYMYDKTNPKRISKHKILRIRRAIYVGFANNRKDSRNS